MPSVLSSVSSDVLEGFPDLSRLPYFGGRGGCFSAEAQVDQFIRVEWKSGAANQVHVIQMQVTTKVGTRPLSRCTRPSC